MTQKLRVATEDAEVIFTCHPIKNLDVGRFSFTQGVLRLSGKDAEEMRKLLEESHVSVRSRVKIIDVARANEIAAEQAKTNPTTKAKAGTTSTSAKPQVVG